MWLIAPHTRLNVSDYRRRTRIISALLLLSSVLLLVLHPVATDGSLIEAYMVGGGLMLFTAYVMLRSGYYWSAAWGAAVYLALLPLVIFLSQQAFTPIGLYEALLFVAPVLLHAFLTMSFTGMVAIFLFVLSGILGIPLLFPSIMIGDLLLPLLGNLTLMTGLLVVAVIRSHDQQALTQQTSQLAESERRYRDLFRATAEGILIYHDGAIRDANPAVVELTGYSLDALTGMPFESLFMPEYRDRIRTLPPNEVYEAQARHQDGRPLWVEVRLRDHVYQGAPVRVANVRNIIPQKEIDARRMEAALERERIGMFQRFMKDMSHDLRTPLAVIKTSVYLIRKLSVDTEKIDRHLIALETQTDRLQSIFDDLLNLSRLDRANTTDYHFIWRDPAPLIRTVIDDHRAAAAAKGQTLGVTIPDHLPRMLLDDPEINRMLRHLITNAIAYTPSGGQITISAQVAPTALASESATRVTDDLVIAITDTGVGISPADQTRVFERFYRADTARSTGTGGAGLGLSIAQRIAAAHRGTITLESEVGRGSTFTVRLPISTAPRANSTSGEAESASSTEPK